MKAAGQESGEDAVINDWSTAADRHVDIRRSKPYGPTPTGKCDFMQNTVHCDRVHQPKTDGQPRSHFLRLRICSLCSPSVKHSSLLPHPISDGCSYL